MALTAEEISDRYPIHWLVWNDQHEELQRVLESKKYTTEEMELKDPRGRTALLLAVTLGHIDTVKVLLDAGADVNCEKDGWTAVQEATATGDIDLLTLVLSRRDHQRYLFRSRGIPDLLNKLSLAPDFYVEMKWQFTSWMPLISRVCPSDTYKVYKRGGNVRVDTTLIGFENRTWQRGDISYVFKGQGTSAKFMEVNHETGTLSTEVIDGRDLWPNPVPRLKALCRRLEEPLAINYLDTDKISFERNKSGIWGWRQDKIENVNGYDCKVFSANNVEIVSKTRCEHLPAGAKRTPRPAPIAGLLGLPEAPNDPSSEEELIQVQEELKNRPGVARKFGFGVFDFKTQYDIEERMFDPNLPGPSSEIPGSSKKWTTYAATKNINNSADNEQTTNSADKEKPTNAATKKASSTAEKESATIEAQKDNVSIEAAKEKAIVGATEKKSPSADEKENVNIEAGKKTAIIAVAKENVTKKAAEKEATSAAEKQNTSIEAAEEMVTKKNTSIEAAKEMASIAAANEHATEEAAKKQATSAAEKQNASIEAAAIVRMDSSALPTGSVGGYRQYLGRDVANYPRTVWHYPPSVWPPEVFSESSDEDHNGIIEKSNYTSDEVPPELSEESSDEENNGKLRKYVETTGVVPPELSAASFDEQNNERTAKYVETSDVVPPELLNKSSPEKDDRNTEKCVGTSDVVTLKFSDKSSIEKGNRKTEFVQTTGEGPSVSFVKEDRKSVGTFYDMPSKWSDDSYEKTRERFASDVVPPELLEKSSPEKDDRKTEKCVGTSDVVTPKFSDKSSIEKVNRKTEFVQTTGEGPSVSFVKEDRKSVGTSYDMPSKWYDDWSDDSYEETRERFASDVVPQEEDNSSGSEDALVPAAPVTWQEYFSGEPMKADIGRPKDMTTKVQKFRATLSLCEDYPLELQEQIMPILDLMTAIASPHFAKLKDFIQMQLPSGFPVKIEIPLYHVMNARITFGNIFATETPVPLVESIQEGDRLSCIIDDQCFDIGRGYKDAGSDDRLSGEDGEEGLLQYAIQQSLMEAGTHEDQVDVWEALRGARPSSPAAPAQAPPQDLLADEERQLQRAIELSLASLSLKPGEASTIPDVRSVGVGVGEGEVDLDLQAALAMSAEEQSAINDHLEAEQRALEEALRLSLLDN